MAMNIRQSDAVNGIGGYPASNARVRKNSLQNLSSGFRIDNGPAKLAEPASQRETGSRVANLENAVRTAAQSVNVQSVSQNALNARNADLVRQRAQGDNALPPAGNGVIGQINTYA